MSHFFGKFLIAVVAVLGLRLIHRRWPFGKYLWLICLACVALRVDAATRWVSPTGTAAWASCVGATPLSGTSACSLATANTNAVAGDVINMRAGTYAADIQPTNSGNGTSLPSTFIVYQAYTGETPTVTGAGDTFDLNLIGISYVRINGITFTQTGHSAYRLQTNSNHNEVENCTFNSDGHPINFFVNDNLVQGSGSSFNWIHNNTFNTNGQAVGNGGLGCTDGGGDTMDIGHAPGSETVEADNNNSVEYNVFNHSPHASIDSWGTNSVIRYNVFHNEPWSLASAACTSSATYPSTYTSSNPNYTSYNGSYAHRNFQIDEDYNRPNGALMLIEGNRSGYAGVNQANGGADNFDLASMQNIVRYNVLYGAMNLGLRTKYSFSSGVGAGGHGGTYNRIYNNTIYQNGYGYTYASTYPSPCSNPSCPWGQAAIGTENNTGNVVKNNILYLSTSYTLRGWDVDSEGAPSNGWTTVTPSNNWCSGAQTGGDNGGCALSGDPKFNNPDLTNPSSLTLPDLSLKASSGAIDQGVALTTATNSGVSSTNLTVADALYFQDGTWGSDLAKASAGLGGTFQADWIAIGTVTNVVQISAVSYGSPTTPAGTITLASPMTWSNGDKIWLKKKSDGANVLIGAAPDIGASEFGGSSSSTLNGISMSGGTIQ